MLLSIKLTIRVIKLYSLITVEQLSISVILTAFVAVRVKLHKIAVHKMLGCPSWNFSAKQEFKFSNLSQTEITLNIPLLSATEKF